MLRKIAAVYTLLAVLSGFVISTVHFWYPLPQAVGQTWFIWGICGAFALWIAVCVDAFIKGSE